jgi:SUKH-3 immunity protein of toxin-antitoxin system
MRFREPVRDVLERAGWFPGRNIKGEVTSWNRELKSSDGFQMFPAAEVALTEFGGLAVNQSASGISCAREPFTLIPILAVGEGDRFRHFSTYLNKDLYPLGEASGGHGFMAMAHTGEVYLLALEILLLGRDIDEALEHLILGVQPQAI